MQRTVTGIASTGADGGGRGPGAGGATQGGGNPGTSLTGSPSFSYRDTWAPNLEVLGSYTYNFSNIDNRSQSNGETYSSRGSSKFERLGTNNSDSRGHNASFRMDWDINKKNYLQITPTYSYTSSVSKSTSVSDNINNYTTGFEHPINSSINTTVSSTPSYGITALYQHIFDKPGRNLSIQTSINKSDNHSERDANNRFQYYADETKNTLLKDSLAHLINRTSNINTTLRSS